MNTEDLGNLRILNWLFKPAGFMMGNRLRGWLMDPERTLRGTYIESGYSVLEVGCGTGFFTLPAARMIGPQGRLVVSDCRLCTGIDPEIKNFLFYKQTPRRP